MLLRALCCNVPHNEWNKLMRSITDCVSCRSAICSNILRVSCNTTISSYSGRMRKEQVLSGFNICHSSVEMVKDVLRTDMMLGPLLRQLTRRNLFLWGRGFRVYSVVRVIARAERDGTHSEIRFRLSPKRTSPFKSVGASVQSIAGSGGVRISLSNAG